MTVNSNIRQRIVNGKKDNTQCIQSRSTCERQRGMDRNVSTYAVALLTPLMAAVQHK